MVNGIDQSPVNGISFIVLLCSADTARVGVTRNGAVPDLWEGSESRRDSRRVHDSRLAYWL
jgi:hypothetical protein